MQTGLLSAVYCLINDTVVVLFKKKFKGEKMTLTQISGRRDGSSWHRQETPGTGTSRCRSSRTAKTRSISFI